MRKKARAKKARSKPFLFVFIVLLIGASGFYFKSQILQPVAPFISPSPTVTLTPAPSTPTPTITFTPTPTPIPLVGYCLKVPVLMYHHIQPFVVAKEKGQSGLSVDNGVFDQQMAYVVSQGYTTLFANDLAYALKNKTQLPAKSIVVSFDDGYRDNHTYALPIIKKYGIKANLLLATGLVEGADYLTWNQVVDMKNSGLYYFVDHTWSHYNVGVGSEDKIRYEIETAKKQIEDRLGQKTDIFGYPYGLGGPVAVKILQQDGFSGAFSTYPGFYQCDSFIYALHRTRIGNSSLSAYGL